MTLGDILKKYREDNNISMDEFSKRSSLSKGYISMLENNINPRNNKPIAPTLPTIQKIATGMGIDIDILLKTLDSEQKISLDSKNEYTTIGETEIHLKKLIIKKYGTIEKFCEIINMPYTILDTIFTQGIANSNIANIIKITKELKIDTESLASGIIVDSNSKTNEQKSFKDKLIEGMEKLDKNDWEELERIISKVTNPKEEIDYYEEAPKTPEELRQKYIVENINNSKIS